MVDLCRRLAVALQEDEGLLQNLVVTDVFDERVEASIRRFQTSRGLEPTGICGRHTWERLVEAGYRLGDRLLYRRSPPLRGEDVADLQTKLGSLGFDAGRIDGIFGDLTAAALADFQRNVGLFPDGRFGTSTMEELLRLRTPADLGAVVASLREREELRHGPQSLAGSIITVAHLAGLDALVEAVRRNLTAAGASVVSLNHPDGSRLAAQANSAGARGFIAFVATSEPIGCTCSYYASYRWESPSGRRLAEALQQSVPHAAGVPALGTKGMSVPILRETRMPAVICEVAPTTALVQRSTEVASSVTDAVHRWLGVSEANNR